MLLQTLSHPLSYEELVASLQDVDKLRSEYMVTETLRLTSDLMYTV